MSQEAMKLALEALESLKVTISSRTEANVIDGVDLFPKQMAALQKALANEALGKMAENARELGLDYEPAQQEPVAVWELFEDGWDSIADPAWMETLPVGTKLYTSPPAQRTWVGLTNDEVNNLAAGCHLGNSVQDAIYKAVAKLKEKNT